jgi:peptidyl-dipeptidase Dcp
MLIFQFMAQSDESNPLLKSFAGKHGVIPFNLLKKEHYLPAIDAGIEKARGRLEVLRTATDTPSFENTALALETLSEELDQAAEIYFNLFSAEADDEFQALAKEISPKLARFSNDISLDEKLFARVKALHDLVPSLKLDSEQKRLVEKQYKGFVRNGALLKGADRDRLRKIDEEVSVLGPKYSENVLKHKNAYLLHLTDEAQLAGLPESTIEAAAQVAKEKGKEGWAVTMDAPSRAPFMKYSERRELREQIYKAQTTTAVGGDYDNRDVLKRIAVLRHERAVLLGFKTHADYTLQERMAEQPGKVTAFLERLLSVAKPAAERDLAELRAFMKSETGKDDFRPWDFSYWSEKLRAKKYDFDDEALRPYFKLENAIDGVFQVATKLFGLSFKVLDGVPVYHPDVKVYEVFDDKTNGFVGLFYTDFFPRETKKSGAWMTPLKEQGFFGGQLRRPHVGIVCNFTKPTATKPSLLTYDEVKTLFHEFGHALHGLLSECRYRSVAGTNVYWDFVELPSQIMENWLDEKETLDLFARHFETGAPMPKELVEKMRRARNFQAGYSALRQVSFGLLDMAWHSADPSGIKDVLAFEEQVMARARVLEPVPGSNMSCSFSHIFAGGYSAGYYSYKWAEVLDADAFEYFKERGLFDREVAAKFRSNILARGGTEHPMELYKRFRGREPDPDALLRRDGLI